MAKKNYYYVLVCTTEGPKFVTGIGEHYVAFWNCEKTPYNMSKSYAEDVVNGLMWNGYLAYLVCSSIKINSHPYNYEKYDIEWKEKEK